MKDPRKLLPEMVREMWEKIARILLIEGSDSAVKGIFSLSSWIGALYPSLSGE
jgi:hypothetical protein